MKNRKEIARKKLLKLMSRNALLCLSGKEGDDYSTRQELEEIALKNWGEDSFDEAFYSLRDLWREAGAETFIVEKH